MADIYILLFIFLIFWYFIYLRKVAEAGRAHAQQYCKKEGLQFIAIARRSSQFSFNKRNGIFIKSVFEFEFSGDGESSVQGLATLFGLKLESMDLPAYRIS